MARIQTATAILAFAASSVAFGAAAESWDMPMAYSDGNFHTQNGKLFAEAVGVCTGGSLEITVHGGGSLFKGNEIKRAVQRGNAPIGERLISALGNEDPIYAIDAIPFLATDYEQARKLYTASKPALEKLLADDNLHLLYAIPWPPQGIYVNRELNSIDDMKGLRFRTYNATLARLAELVGATPTQIEAAELSQALATGVVEAFMTSGATGVDSQVWEHVKYFYNAQAWLPKNMVFVNKRTWEALDDDTRAKIEAVAAEIEAEGLGTKRKAGRGLSEDACRKRHGCRASGTEAGRGPEEGWRDADRGLAEGRRRRG